GLVATSDGGAFRRAARSHADRASTDPRRLAEDSRPPPSQRASSGQTQNSKKNYTNYTEVVPVNKPDKSFRLPPHPLVQRPPRRRRRRAPAHDLDADRAVDDVELARHDLHLP